MSKFIDHLRPSERAELAEMENLRDKHRHDATYYAGRIKKIMDRVKARVKREEGRV